VAVEPCLQAFSAGRGRARRVLVPGTGSRPDGTVRLRLVGRRGAWKLVPAGHVAPDPAAGFVLRGGMAEPVEQLQLLLPVSPRRSGSSSTRSRSSTARS